MNVKPISVFSKVEKLNLILKSDGSILFDYTTANGRHTYRYIRVKDVSTGKHSYLSIPYELYTCEQAIAWTFGMSPFEYKPTKES